MLRTQILKNHVLTHWLLDYIDTSIMLDNEAIYSIAQKKLNIKKPKFLDLNIMIAKLVSCVVCLKLILKKN